MIQTHAFAKTVTMQDIEHTKQKQVMTVDVKTSMRTQKPPTQRIMYQQNNKPRIGRTTAQEWSKTYVDPE